MTDRELSLGEAIAILVTELPGAWQAAAKRLLEHVDVMERLGTTEDVRTHIVGVAEGYTYEELDMGESYRCVQIIPTDMSKDRIAHRVFYTAADEPVLMVRAKRLVGDEMIRDQTIVHSTYPELKPGDPAPF